MSDDWRLAGATRDVQSITAHWDPLHRPMIDGVRIHEVRPVPKGNGLLTEVFRRDWGTDDLPIDQVFQVLLVPGGISAWHAHEHTTDRLFVAQGQVRFVLYDARPGSPTCGMVTPLLFGEHRPALVVVPPRVWHGVQNIGSETACVLNLVDVAYDYAAPDHWRVPADSPDVPFRFTP